MPKFPPHPRIYSPCSPFILSNIAPGKFPSLLKIFAILPFLIPTDIHSSSSSSSTGLSPIAPYYRPHELFDQTSVLQNPEHREYLNEMGIPDHQIPISNSCLDNFRYCDTKTDYVAIEIDSNFIISAQAKQGYEAAVEDDYWRNRRWLYSKAIAQEFSSIVLLTTPLVIGYYIALAMDTPSLASMLITTAFLATVYSTTPLRTLIAALFFPANDPFVPYESAFAKRKLALGYLDWDGDREREKQGFVNDSAEEAFLTARLGMLNPRASFDYLETLLKVPTESTPLKLNKQWLSEILNIYDERAVRQIAISCINHQESYQKKWGINKQQREFLTLISPPGQGKSYCVTQIALSLGGIPMVRLDLSGITPEGLLGSQTEPGVLLSAIIQLSHRNGILFIDELCHVAKDERLLATLLTTLDPTRKTFYSNYLQRTIDLSHLFIIVAGNNEFKEDALKSRFSTQKTVDLTITKQSAFFDNLLDRYYQTKTGKILNRKDKTNWRQKLTDYFSKERPLSFRDGQNLIDCLVGEERLNDLIL